jgi:integrase
MEALMEAMTKPRPAYVQHERSRTGASIWYVRIGDSPRIRLRAPYGGAKWATEYRAAVRKLDGIAKAPKGEGDTLQWLWDAYHKSADWQRLDVSTRRARENIMRHVVEKAGNMPFLEVTRGVIKRAYDDRAATPSAARKFVLTMRSLFRWAVEAELIEADPTRDVRAPATATDGHHTWTQEEMTAFENAWAIGTRERLAYDVLVYTGLRRGDAARLGRQHLKGMVFSIRTEKTGQMVDISVHPALRRSLDAGPCGDLAYIVGENGKPMTKESFGNWFGEVCAKTGVPGRAHGLRKALATKLAEKGATEAEMDAAFAWRGAGMASLYTRKANRSRLSAQAHARLVENETEPGYARAGNAPSVPSKKT